MYRFQQPPTVDASATERGLMGIVAQIFAGAKTFTNLLTASAGLVVGGDLTTSGTLLHFTGAGAAKIKIGNGVNNWEIEGTPGGSLLRFGNNAVTYLGLRLADGFAVSNYGMESPLFDVTSPGSSGGVRFSGTPVMYESGSTLVLRARGSAASYDSTTPAVWILPFGVVDSTDLVLAVATSAGSPLFTVDGGGTVRPQYLQIPGSQWLALGNTKITQHNVSGDINFNYSAGGDKIVLNAATGLITGVGFVAGASGIVSASGNIQTIGVTATGVQGYLNLIGSYSNVAGAKVLKIGNSVSLSTPGAELVSIYSDNMVTKVASVAYDGTVTATGFKLDGAITDTSGTPGNATINAYKGRAAMASTDSSVTITNSKVTANSVVIVMWEPSFVAAWKVIPSSGSFVIEHDGMIGFDATFRFAVL